MAAPALEHATFAPPPPVAHDTDGLLLCAFYIAARGFTAEAARLLPTCRELGEDEGEESLLRGLIAGEMKVERGGGVVRRPRLHAAARVGSARRVAALVRVGARVGAVNKERLTALMVAAWWGREGVVHELLGTADVDAAFVGARIAGGKVNAGYSAFSLACVSARDKSRLLSEGERAAAAACAHALAASPLMGPGNIGGSDGTALLWACFAGLEDVVRSWLGDARCTAAIVAQRDTTGTSAFSLACHWARDMDRKLSEGERTAAAACARALAASPLMGPGDLGSNDGTALLWACRAGLEDVVRSWLGDPRCTAAIVAQRNKSGYSAFSVACYGAHNADGLLTEGERTASVACAILVATRHQPGDAVSRGAGSSALLWACQARLAPIVALWVASPPCTRELLTQCGSNCVSPFSAACRGARDASRHLAPTERADAAQCARIIAASPHMRPGDLGEHGGTALMWASWAGLHDVATTLLASPLCTRDVVTARSETGESAFSAACRWAGDSKRMLSVIERADAAWCAKALAASPHLSPADTSHGGSTALSSACGAGLAGIVSVMLADARCTYIVVNQCDMEGRSASSTLLERCGAATMLTAEEQRDTAACARALGGSTHVPWPIRERCKAAALA